MEKDIYIAFLRGINVGGHNKIKMADLRNWAGSIGLLNVKTYIQSGNMVFVKADGNAKELTVLLAGLLEAKCGKSIKVLVFKVDDIKRIIFDNPFKNHADTKQLYFTVLADIPEKGFVHELESQKYVNEEFKIVDNCIYLKYLNGYGKSKLNNKIIEKTLKVDATSRNWATMHKMLQLAEEISAG